MLKRFACLLLCLAMPACLPAQADDSLSHIVPQVPVKIERATPDTSLVDFGKVAFGNLTLTLHAGKAQQVTVRFGEALHDGRIDRNPPGSVRYAEVRVDLQPGQPTRVAPPADARNTHPPAVLTPQSWGVVLPFRWVEVEGWPGPLRSDEIQRNAAFDRTWSDDAASFHSSDAMLDRIWQLSHDSIKATTFAGVFVDGDRERIAYEADAYLNQLGYYAGDADPRMARATFERLLQYPTWPSEWPPHLVFMAYADWMQTGDRAWLAQHYEALQSKMLSERAGADGLVTSTPAQMRRGDIVDWPQGERDGYVFTPVNTVVNAFHLRALQRMQQIATAIGKMDDAAKYAAELRTASANFYAKLFDARQGLYRDGVGTDHASLHANLFPLAFDLVPAGDQAHVAAWLADRGMAGSVYAAQYLLEGLLAHGQAEAALHLMTAEGDRSWRHMVDTGATITWEAWDQKYKPNQDWNHAWGAAPANLLPRFVLGAQPLTPGWTTALIEPHPGDLRSAEGSLPTPLGELRVHWTADGPFQLRCDLPHGMRARLRLPERAGTAGVWVNGRRASATRTDGRWQIDLPGGSYDVQER